MPETDASIDESIAQATETEGATATEGRSTLGTARIIGFYLSVLATIGLFVIILGEFLLLPFAALPPEIEAQLAPHLFHDTVYVMMLWIALLGLVIQLYRPADKFVGVLGFLVIVGLLGAAFAVPVANGTMPLEDLLLIATFTGLGLVIAVLHPASRAIIRPKLGDRVDRVALGLVAVAAIPLLLYVVNQYLLQFSESDPLLHIFAGHYGAMAAAAGSILVLSIVAVFAPVGWRIAAVGAGLLALVWGGNSVLYPALESSGGLLWGALAILWAIAFVAVTEYGHRGDLSPALPKPQAPRAT